MAPAWLKRMARELVVPWSNARTRDMGTPWLGMMHSPRRTRRARRILFLPQRRGGAENSQLQMGPGLTQISFLGGQVSWRGESFEIRGSAGASVAHSLICGHLVVTVVKK